MPSKRYNTEGIIHKLRPARYSALVWDQNREAGPNKPAVTCPVDPLVRPHFPRQHPSQEIQAPLDGILMPVPGLSLSQRPA